jgi:hypothetical protein
MGKLNPKTALLALAALMSACSNSFVAPSIQVPVQGDVILNSTFESNGNPSLQGWKSRDPSSTSTNLALSSDFPAGGSRWSLRITAAAVETTVTFINPDSIRTYVITFWAKGNGAVDFSIYSGGRGVGIVGPVNSTSWTAISDTLVRVDSTENTLHCELASVAADSSSSVLFNDVEVVAIKP